MFEEKLLALRCTSALAPCMTDFVEQKRALGNKYNGCVEALNMFDRFCNEHGVVAPCVSSELLSLWEAKRPHENASTHQLRVACVRSLCRHMNSCGFDAPAAFHPEPKRSTQFLPHIFTKDELSRLFAAADRMKRRPVSPYRHLVVPALLRLIYTCGLRASEATRLRVADVDLEQGTACIHGAKGDKDRMVGISSSMLDHLRRYRRSPEICRFASDYFFPAPDGGFYDVSTIYGHFRELLFSAGIPHRGRGKGPRLHDLRHSFAVHVLNRWSEEGKDIYTCLPLLRIFLGHSDIAATETYLRLTPEVYGEITRPFAERFKSITEAFGDEGNP